MSGSVNRIMLLGRLGRDPELRYTSEGAPVVSLSVATDEQWKDKNGEKQQKTEWHRVVAWNKLAELCAEYLAKGRQVYVEGKLQTRQWEDKEGNKKITTEIVASSVVFLGGGNGETKSTSDTETARTPPAVVAPPQEENLPF